jgi:lysophospholipase L1-like esterase
VLALVGVLAAGCGGSEPVEPRAPRDGAVVAVIGDSYMAGFGASTAEHGMAPLLADRLDLDLANFAVGGTGYVNGGAFGGVQSYPVQAGSAIAADANLYLVEGGLNDWLAVYKDKTADLADVTDAAGELYRRLVEEEGADHVIVMGPIWPYDAPDPGIEELNDALRAEAEAAGLDYIDAYGQRWINAYNNDQYIGPDLAHPNDLGHIYLARKIAGAVGDLR